jgi:hypothetical protein
MVSYKYFHTMYSLNIHYKRNSFPFGEMMSDSRDNSRTKISPNTYASEYMYSMFYDRLFSISGERGIFKEVVKNIGIQGPIEPFAKEAWTTFFPETDIYIDEEPEIDSDDEIEDIPYDIYLIKSKEFFINQIEEIVDIYPMIAPGGIILAEGIFPDKSAADYLVELAPHLREFQDYYFVSLEHDLLEYVNLDKPTKVLVLVKKGPAFVVPGPKITMITPSCRPEHLAKIKETVPMDWIHQWFVVYDGKKVKEDPQIFKEDTRIKEYVFQGEGISGNPQRNFALDFVESNIEDFKDTYFYFLDDDNVFHPNLQRLLPFLDGSSLFSFDQYNRIKGGTIELYKIDTAMVLFPVDLVKKERWIPELYNADGHYIIKCMGLSPNHWTYVKNDLCFYNYLE